MYLFKQCCIPLHLREAKKLPPWLNFFPGRREANICKFRLCFYFWVVLQPVRIRCMIYLEYGSRFLTTGSVLFLFTSISEVNRKSTRSLSESQHWRFLQKHLNEDFPKRVECKLNLIDLSINYIYCVTNVHEDRLPHCNLLSKLCTFCHGEKKIWNKFGKKTKSPDCPLIKLEKKNNNARLI